MDRKLLCPVWIGYMLACPLRRLFQNPEKILAKYVREGMKVLDIGCAMGFFSLPLARMVGEKGKVICVDMQKKMIESLEKRARKAGISERIESRICTEHDLGLHEMRQKIDFALAFAVIHEVPDAAAFLAEVYETIKPAGQFLIAEPKGHVSEKEFDKLVSAAEQTGFKAADMPHIVGSYAVLLEKR
ncbi:MAG: methyltransferase type 11 [Desulfobacteraceae bacterium IS3]|nr:MAG: methyltransferase type 11 [Desulfobacteraceae bacterium IS3]